MVISSLNTKLVEDRLAFILKAMSNLRRLAALGEKEFLEGDHSAAAESYLRRALEAVFDIGRHIHAKTAASGLVEYKAIARSLGELGIVTPSLAERLQLIAGYRNRLIHFYHEVSDRELYRILRDNLADLDAFVQAIRQFLEAYKRRV